MAKQKSELGGLVPSEVHLKTRDGTELVLGGPSESHMRAGILVCGKDSMTALIGIMEPVEFFSLSIREEEPEEPSIDSITKYLEREPKTRHHDQFLTAHIRGFRGKSKC